MRSRAAVPVAGGRWPVVLCCVRRKDQGGVVGTCRALGCLGPDVPRAIGLARWIVRDACLSIPIARARGAIGMRSPAPQTSLPQTLPRILLAESQGQATDEKATQSETPSQLLTDASLAALRVSPLASGTEQSPPRRDRPGRLSRPHWEPHRSAFRISRS